MELLRRELGALYEAFSRRKPSPLPQLELQYADYTLWQRQWLKDDELQRQLQYWTQKLSGAPAALELPGDRPRPGTASFRGAMLPFKVRQEDSEALQRLARQQGATLYMVLLAAFKVVLARWSGQSDIIVGSPIAGRTHRQLESIVGFFVNTLALRTDLSGNPSFSDLVGRVKETALQAYAHQDLPFEKLMAELSPVRDLSRQPIFQVVFGLNNFPQSALQVGELRITRQVLERETSKFDLSWFVTPGPSGLECLFEYATDLFDHSTIERMAAHLRRVLEQVAAQPGRRLGELDLLSPSERQQVLLEWNATRHPYRTDVLIH